MTNVVHFTGQTTVKQDADQILEANKGVFDELIYMGHSKDGQFIAGGNISDVGQILIFIELLKRQLLDGME